MWMANWDNLIEFETYPVTTSEEAGEKAAARMLRPVVYLINVALA